MSAVVLGCWMPGLLVLKLRVPENHNFGRACACLVALRTWLMYVGCGSVGVWCLGCLFADSAWLVKCRSAVLHSFPFPTCLGFNPSHACLHITLLAVTQAQGTGSVSQAKSQWHRASVWQRGSGPGSSLRLVVLMGWGGLRPQGEAWGLSVWP